MLDIPGVVWGALGVLVAVVVYFLAWRATRGGSAVMQILVRGGLAVLLLAPVILLLTPASHTPFDRIETELQSPSRMATRDKALEERLPREDGESETIDVMPPPAANGQSASEPMLIEPPPVPEAMAPAAPEALAPAAPEAMAPAAPEAMAPMARESLPEAAAPEAPAAPSADRSAQPQPRSAAASSDVDETFQVVPVFYGTDREEEPNPKRAAYNSERGRRLALGRALVTVPKVHEVPQIERPWTLRVPYFNVVLYQEEEDPQKHFTLQEVKKLTTEDFLRLVRERIAASNRFKDHALVFVHGYNTAFDSALYRTAQIAYDLKFDSAAFAYSWPSGGAVASYTYDRESAGAARPYLRQFLDLVVKETGAKAISVIAHSMGNQPLLEVLKDMRSSTPEGVVINQMILAAPDVDADNFTNLASTIGGFANGVTLYAAANDRALIISRNFWQNPRAGDVPVGGPLIVSGVDTIDITAASTDVFAFNHSGYAEHNALLQDIGKLIQNGVRPPDVRQPSLKRITTDRGDYWRYSAP
jgi:esterase/lipase superfamily enzyme